MWLTAVSGGASDHYPRQAQGPHSVTQRRVRGGRDRMQIHLMDAENQTAEHRRRNCPSHDHGQLQSKNRNRCQTENSFKNVFRTHSPCSSWFCTLSWTTSIRWTCPRNMAQASSTVCRRFCRIAPTGRQCCYGKSYRFRDNDNITIRERTNWYQSLTLACACLCTLYIR